MSLLMVEKNSTALLLFKMANTKDRQPEVIKIKPYIQIKKY